MQSPELAEESKQLLAQSQSLQERATKSIEEGGAARAQLRAHAKALIDWRTERLLREQKQAAKEAATAKRRSKNKAATKSRRNQRAR